LKDDGVQVQVVNDVVEGEGLDVLGVHAENGEDWHGLVVVDYDVEQDGKDGVADHGVAEHGDLVDDVEHGKCVQEKLAYVLHDLYGVVQVNHK